MQSAVTQLIDRFKKWWDDPLSNWHQLQSDPLQAVHSHPLAPEARSQGLTVKDVGTLNHYAQDELPPSKGLGRGKKKEKKEKRKALWSCHHQVTWLGFGCLTWLHKCGSGVTCVAIVQSEVKVCIRLADWQRYVLSFPLCANCMNVKYQQGQ